MSHTDNPLDDLITLQNSVLQVHCNSRCGGRISHFVPRATDQNQFHWDPPQMDPRQLTSFVPIGGWNDMLLSSDLRFPGLHWNQPFQFDPLGEGQTLTARMFCETDGLRTVRTITVAEDKPTVTIATEYRNVSGKAFRDVHIRTQPILRPGGARTPETIVLWPTAQQVGILTLADSVRGAGRFAPQQQKAEANWWGCCDPESGVSLLIEDTNTFSEFLNLVQETNLLMLENVGLTGNLLPDDVRKMQFALHYYPLDLRPWIDRLGASRLVASKDWLIGLRLDDAELSLGTQSLAVRLTCISLAQNPPPRSSKLQLLDDTGGALQEWYIELRQTVNVRVAEATETLELGILDLGTYTLAFSPAGASQAVSMALHVVEQTQRQKQTSFRLELSGQLDRCEKQTTAFSVDHFAGTMVLHDLAAARCFLRADKLELARQSLDFIENALRERMPDEDMVHPYPQELNVPDDWFRAIEGSVPELPVLSLHPEHYGTFNDHDLMNGWHWQVDAQTVYALTWLYFHTSSRYYGQTEVLRRAVLAVDELCRSFSNGSLPSDIATDTNINRFTLCPLGEALRILIHLPITPARKSFWRRQYLAAADQQIREYGGQSIPEKGYLNQDVMYLLIMRFSHELSGDPQYREQCGHILDMIESQLLPDGAFYYLYPHSEVSHYHEINITYLFRDWKLSDEARSRRLVEGTVRYYPLMVTADGWVEFSSQTWWKHIGMRWPLFGPTIVAGITGDRQNQYIAMQSEKKPVNMAAFNLLLYAALAAREDVKPEPLPECLLVLDRNIQGPRGRFGTFSWMGTTAPYRDTLVGCLLSEPDRNRAYAMHYAGPQVLFGSKDEANTYLGGVGLAMSPSHYESDVVIKAERAALAARYDLFPYEHEIDPEQQSDWICEQLWYFDDERMVGLMRLTAVKETQARAVDLSIRFADYDAVWQKAETELHRTGDGLYAAGPLRLRVLAHNLESEILQDTWICAYDRKTPGKGVFARSAPRSGLFPQDASYTLLAEVRPHTSPVVPIVLLEGDSFGFRIETGDTIITVAMDETENKLRCELTSAKKFFW